METVRNGVSIALKSVLVCICMCIVGGIVGDSTEWSVSSTEVSVGVCMCIVGGIVGDSTEWSVSSTEVSVDVYIYVYSRWDSWRQYGMECQ